MVGAFWLLYQTEREAGDERVSDPDHDDGTGCGVASPDQLVREVIGVADVNRFAPTNAENDHPTEVEGDKTQDQKRGENP